MENEGRATVSSLWGGESDPQAELQGEHGVTAERAGSLGFGGERGQWRG